MRAPLSGSKRWSFGVSNAMWSVGDSPTYPAAADDCWAALCYMDGNRKALGLERLIQIYFKAIDPTSLNRQGEDEGTR